MRVAVREPGQVEGPGKNGIAEKVGLGDKVMVIAGRDEANCHAVCEVLEAIGAHPLTMRESLPPESSGAEARDLLDQAFARCRAAVVVLTPDDDVRLGPHLGFGPADAELCFFRTQARAEVCLGAGMAMARMPESTVVLDLGVDEPMPMAELVSRIHVDTPGQWRAELSDWLLNLGVCVSPRDQWRGVGKTVCRRRGAENRMSWQDVEAAVEALTHELRAWRGPDCIVGLGSGGAVVAGMLAEHFGQPRIELLDVEGDGSTPEVRWRGVPDIADRSSPLLVTDIVRDVGDFAAARAHIVEEIGSDIRTATLATEVRIDERVQDRRNRLILDFAGCQSEFRQGLRMPWS
ncbi:MAG TPA: TIR domain-containing protein [Solirubrobacterales bacterium]|nr:TIR domain-containing protein [Solirubrobacterales bacterium]